MNEIINGPALDILKGMPDRSVQCCVTSPPYWGLRDYGVEGQLGLEATPGKYVAKITEIFREVRRVLRDDGTLWLNLGDSYNGSGGVGGPGKSHTNQGSIDRPGNRAGWSGLKPKDLCGIPWRVAFNLQRDGWYLRSDIIWHKPNPMPESVTDRPTKSHEYLFLMSKSKKYYYDHEAIRERSECLDEMRPGTGVGWDKASMASPHDPRKTRRRIKTPDGWDTSTGEGGHGTFHKKGREKGKYIRKSDNGREQPAQDDRTRHDQCANGRNKRTVWTITTQPYKDAHFATFPEDLIIPCIKAGTSEEGCCPKCGAPMKRVTENETKYIGNSAKAGRTPEEINDSGKWSGFQEGNKGLKSGPVVETKTKGWEPTCACKSSNTEPCIVMDPFMGSGTTALVASKLGRKFIGIELNEEYCEMARKRIKDGMGLFLK